MPTGKPDDSGPPQMCMGIAPAWSEVPTEPIGRHGLERRVHERVGEREIRFLFGDPRLPIWRGGRLQRVRWGNARVESRSLPRLGWTWLSTIQAGCGRDLEPIAVEIPATVGLDRGAWFRIRPGIRGRLVPDERGPAVCYRIREPSGHDDRIMTRSDRMPVPIEERIGRASARTRDRPGVAHAAATCPRRIPSPASPPHPRA